jgi:hypothetical protein
MLDAGWVARPGRVRRACVPVQQGKEPGREAVQRSSGRASWTPPVAELLELQRLAGNRVVGRLLQGRGGAAQRAAAGAAGGLPDRLKSGVEVLSGYDLSNVRVHANSDKPAGVKALAYTQGSDIHVAPGQEHHLPHEAWHVVQQAQGRVSPTMQMHGWIPVNDDEGLEREADMMGDKAFSTRAIHEDKPVRAHSAGPGQGPIQRVGEQKTDFSYAGTDSPVYREGEALFRQALTELRILRQAEKARIFTSVTDIAKAKKKPAEGFTAAYGGGLRNLKNQDLLQKTANFAAAAPPRLVLDGTQVLYEKAASDAKEPPARVLIATLTNRTFAAKTDQPKEAKRPVETAGDGTKEYVRDDRTVPTRRFAYVEKNYWQFMEFAARNKLEGRYQTFFRAANQGAARPEVRTAAPRDANLVGAAGGATPLTDDQLAVLHQWKGSGPQQRGLSLTSTPRKGETIGNAGENFRSNVGVRLTVDLARIATGPDSPIMFNHYASQGVKDASGTSSAVAAVQGKYKYIDSVIKNRELFLEFVKPEWITKVEYHDKGGEREFTLGDSADAMMDAVRRGTGYDKFAAGFQAKITDTALDTASAGDEDYNSGVGFAEEYIKGYDQGTTEAESARTSGATIDALALAGGPKNPKDIFVIGRTHGRAGREKPKTLPAVWA